MVINIITTTTAFTCFNFKRKKYRLITININNCGLTLHSWLFIEIQLNVFMPVKLDKSTNHVGKYFLTNPNIFFSLNIYECAIYNQHQLINFKDVNMTIKSSFFHVTCQKIFWNISKAQIIWNNFRTDCCKFVNFFTRNKQVTICMVTVQA